MFFFGGGAEDGGLRLVAEAGRRLLMKDNNSYSLQVDCVHLDHDGDGVAWQLNGNQSSTSLKFVK